MSDKTKYTVGEHEITLGVPASYAVRLDIIHAQNSNRLRATAAALGACWRGPGRPSARYELCDYNPLLFGGQVLDELQGRGVELRTVFEVGTHALDMLAAATFPTKQGVDAAEGFSDRSGEGSTS
jgi:hypothetical protein